MVPLDTKPAIFALQMELLRRKLPEERLELARQWSLFAQSVAFAGVRSAQPELTDDEVWLKLAVHRLGAETLRKVRAHAATRSI